MSALATRRGLLRIITAAPIVVTACAAGTPAYAEPTAFAAQLARYRQLEAIYDEAETAHDAADTAFLECRPTRPPTASMPGDTAETFNARVAQEKAAHERVTARARESCRLDWHEKRAAETCAASVAAFDALMIEPAPTVAAAATKLQLLIDRGACWSDLAPLLADLRRLGGEA